ncbi:hypothetical protein [Cohnella sp. REN36]|uniref:hypothetical protein n=1 Tax=Cohnella sp. REN36 TaxID=2887347 RepID=UPI001D15A470|nr:hypothetical protein [Cohnella sp. REN36]MCC3377158.1 hypothetical protein [Cohnella sp. REN36]
MEKFLGFMFFSSVEVLALIAITLTIFRFKISDYIWQSVLIAIVMNIMSFVLRNELDLPSLAPISNVIAFALFIYIFLKEPPLVWSFIMSLTGTVAFVIIQAIFIACSFGTLSIHAVDSDLVKGYMLQTMTGVTIFIISYMLYKRGWGYSAEFTKLKFKWERFVVLGMIIIITAALGALLYYKDLLIDILFLFLAFLFIIFYTTKY